MKAIIQRVSEASVTIDGEISGSIEKGLMVLLGIHKDDDEKIMDWMINKIVNLRIFEDEAGKMNLSVKDIGSGILVVSNFTLYGNAKKGFRPSFTEAAKPDISEPLYDKFLEKISREDINVQSGEFGAMMDIKMTNAGPVTIILEK